MITEVRSQAELGNEIELPNFFSIDNEQPKTHVFTLRGVEP